MLSTIIHQKKAKVFYLTLFLLFLLKSQKNKTSLPAECRDLYFNKKNTFKTMITKSKNYCHTERSAAESKYL
jgi:hypothetical protein